MNNITGECQAGFKRNYSTTDHMFTLLALIRKQFSLNRKMYVAFIFSYMKILRERFQKKWS